MAEQLENAEVPWSASVSSDAWAPPSAFDEYRLLSAIARGGMGSVYLAHDTLLDRRVAIKFISGLAPDTAAREQFLIEARAAARLQHPNVLTIHRVGELQGRPYIVAEFLRGMSLDIAEKPMVWSRVIELGIGLSRGLAAAHRRGVLHRDIKPSNAIIGEDGDVKLLDFGLAKLLDAGAQAERLSDIPVKPVSRDAVTIGFAASEGGDAPPDGHAAPPVVAPLAPPLRTRRSSAPPASPMPGIEPERPRSAASANVTVSNSADLVGQGGAGRARSAPMTTHRLMGTPLYMPPEIWRGEAATPRSDIYSLGVVLYELCAGDPPFRSVPLRELPTAVQTLEPLPIADVVPGIDPRFAAIIDRCLLHDPNDRFASGDELRDALEQIALPDTKGRGHLPEGNPYRGLLAFEAEHRRLFFGREREIRAIVERLRSESFVLIASDSGVGKSSLCAAGVLPHIAEGAFGDGRTWIEVRVVPGRRPLTVLVAALAPVLGIEEAELAERLRAEPSALGRDLRMKLGDKGGLLLFVDQLEELIGLSDVAEAAIVGEVLGHLTPRTPGLCLLMAVRSDFLTRVSAIPRLGDELSRALYLLRPLPREGIREAIVGPAREIGVSFESESLVDTLIESTAHAEGGLPLLQFALAELWEAREAATSRITADALEQIGGVAGALARHADGIVEGLPGPPRSAARRILVALVALDGTRVSRTEAELVGEDPAARTALDALLRGRLLVAREGEHGPVYEVAHEALLKGWGTLRRWLEEQADSRAVHHRIASAAQEWARIGRAREALWGARQSAEAVIVDKAELTPLERAFLRASRRAVRNDRIRRWVALASVPTLAGVLYAGMQIQHRREVEQRVQIELQKVDSSLSAVRAKTVEHEALRRRALDAYDGRRRSEGDALWSQVLSSASAIEAAYGGVTFALETALAIDPERERVRQLLADVVYERIRSTEEDNNPALRLELLRRLELYDEGGAHKRLLNMPAHVAVASSPSGARVTLEQFVESDGQKMTLIDKKELGTTPTLELEVAPGSYMLTITASDRPAVRYPILSRRGERFAVNVDLPVSSDVPEGFVYVPAGRFLVGSATDDTLRREFFTTVPLHEVTTPGYIISRYETTYRDWIEFLRALPPDERARRAPAVGTGTLAALLRLQERPDGQFELTIRISAQPLVVREGEMVTYSTRKTRVAHDWRRFPVAGVTLDDAQAYTRWLDETRRVPGARLCTEHEWERAARGADGREYPTGSQLSPDDANFDETYGKDPPSMGPDEVGSHPASESPFGVHDMAGNLFEWASSSIDSASGVIRGGGWYYSRMSSRSVNRTAPEVTMRDPTVGVRVCASRGEK